VGFSIRHVDDLERPWPNWALARRSLGVAAFGLNVAILAPGDELPAHDEVARDQEEVFLALAGTPTLLVDGEAHPLPPGTFARLDPEPVRTVRNDGPDEARVLIVSAPRTSGYEPPDWA
jgi:uncharacterized cupin superfamily protein